MSLLASFFILAGALFAFIASLGIVRLPDIMMRLHAATKAGSFGTSLLLIGAALAFQSLRVLVIAVLIVVFFYITAPVSAHLLGRAAYLSKSPLWPGTKTDELRSKYTGGDE